MHMFPLPGMHLNCMLLACHNTVCTVTTILALMRTRQCARP
jgi:hypothetical protein